MNYLLFAILGLLELIIITFITNRIYLSNESIGINYNVFDFTNDGEKKCGLNILIRILFPTVYMVIVSGILYEFNLDEFVINIFAITIFYYIFRFLNIVFILNRKELINWKFEFIVFLIGVLISFILYNCFVIKTRDIFIPIDELRNAVWFAIISFVFILIRNYIYNNLSLDIEKEYNRKENYILKKYEYFRNKYNDIITEENLELKSIIYAIMICENYNRPPFYRILENIKCKICGQATLGVMQVKSRVIISDEMSVKLGYEKLKKAYYKNKELEKTDEYLDAVRKTILQYNDDGDYADKVTYIAGIIEYELSSK